MYVGVLLKGEKGRHTFVLSRTASTDDVLRYVTHLTFGGLHLLILNYSLYSEGEEWFEMLLYFSDRSQLP